MRCPAMYQKEVLLKEINSSCTFGKNLKISNITKQVRLHSYSIFVELSYQEEVWSLVPDGQVLSNQSLSH